MGKQICFFANETDINNMISIIKQKNGIIIIEDGYELNEFELLNITNQEYCRQRFKHNNFFIKLISSKTEFNYYPKNERKCIDEMVSDVIQFGVCKPVMQKDGYFEHGRFWYQTKYLINGKNIIKSKDIELLYNSLRNYIIKNYRKSRNKLWYIGPDTYIKYKQGLFIPCSLNTLIEFI
jgi:hypothetical protein